MHDDEDDDDDDDQMEDPNSSYRGVDFVEAEYEDFAKLTLPRRRLARWCNEPFFGKAVKNCYVRLGAGYEKGTKKKRYKLFQINAVTTNPAEYSFPRVGNQKAVSYSILFQ